MADHLSDHIRFLTLVLSDDVNPGRLAELRSTLREHSNESPTCWLHDWLGLDAAEVQIVWLLAAIAADPSVRQLVNESCASSSGDPTLDWIRRLVYGHELTPQALHALSDDGRLRALNIIERSDSGGGT